MAATRPRLVLTCARSGSPSWWQPFTDEIHFGERVGADRAERLGQDALMRVLAGEREPDAGELVVGPRVSTGFFTQLQSRSDLAGRS